MDDYRTDPLPIGGNNRATCRLIVRRGGGVSCVGQVTHDGKQWVDTELRATAAGPGLRISTAPISGRLLRCRVSLEHSGAQFDACEFDLHVDLAREEDSSTDRRA